ncbi:MAG: hypothetical protein AB1746_13350 [Candidatus Zixiibacteriota bacterium]
MKKEIWRFIIITMLIIIPIVLGCTSNPKDIMITEENQDKIFEEVKDLKGLTVEESRLLFAYLTRLKIGEVIGQDRQQIVGKTIGDLIHAQMEFEANIKKQEEEQARLAAELKLREDSLALELKNAITLTVYEKSFIESDVSANRYNDYIVIRCVYQNTSNKNIRAFTGRIRFTDLFDRKIFESNITISDPIKAGAKNKWSGTIEYNQFMVDYRALRNSVLTDMKIEWLPREILFEDGSKLGGDNSSE